MLMKIFLLTRYYRIFLWSLLFSLVVLTTACHSTSGVATPTPVPTSTPTPQAVDKQDDMPTVKIIVALQPIPRGSEFVYGSIGPRPVYADQMPPGIINDEAETIGRLAKQDIEQGEIIRRSMLMNGGDWALSSAPTITDGTAYFGRREGLLFAADPQSGREIWGFPAGQVTASATIEGDVLYVIGSDALYAVDSKTGQQIWRFNINVAEAIQPVSPLVANGTVYFRNRGWLYAVDSGTGDELWQVQVGNEIVSPLNVTDGTVYFTDRSGTFYAVDEESGKEMWRVSPDWYLATPSSAVIVDEVAYFGRRDGFLLAVDTRTEAGIWSFPAGRVTAPPTIVGDGLYVFGNGILYGLDVQSGQEIWRFDGIGEVEIEQISAPIVADNSIFFKHLETLYAVKANTGDELWRFEANYKIVSPPEAIDGLIYFTDSEGYFYAVDVETGQKVWWVKPALPEWPPIASIGPLLTDQSAIDFYRLAAESERQLKNNNPDLALLLGIEAGRKIETAELFAVVRQAIAYLGQTVLVLSGHTGGINQASWNASSNQILTASADGTARVWDATSGTELIALSGHTDSVNQAIWNTDESLILTASDDGTARVWDAETGSEFMALPLQAKAITQALWMGNEERILTVDAERTVGVWDVKSGTNILTLFEKDGNAVWNVDGSRILISHQNRATAQVWDAERGAKLVDLPGHRDGVWDVAWSVDGSRLVTVSGQGTLRVWDVETGSELIALPDLETGVQVMWNGDASRILTIGRYVQVWDAETGERLSSIFYKRQTTVDKALWNVDESQILTFSEDGTAQVWDAEKGTRVHLFFRGGSYISDGMWNADGSHILTISDDNVAQVWDAEKGTALATLFGHTDWVGKPTWNVDESRILTFSADGTARIWTLEPATELPPLFASTANINQTRWSTDDSRSLTITEERRVQIQATETGVEPISLIHPMRVTQAIWGPETKRVLTTSNDGIVRVWEAATGIVLFSVPARMAQWDQDGNRILVANDIVITNEDGIVQQYYTRLEDLLAVACQYSPRNMSLTEWQQFMGYKPYRETCPGKFVLQK